MKEMSTYASGATASGAGDVTSSRVARRVFMAAAAIAAVAIVGQVLTVLRSHHEFTQVESIVAIHATMLAEGDGLYYDLQEYPFTISPYGPVYYSLSAALHRIGLPILAAGRLISLAALAGILFLSWRLLLLETRDRAASLVGTLLIAATANVLKWGTVGQVDALGLCFSVAAFWRYSVYRANRNPRTLVWCGLCIALAIFTKQTFLAAGTAVVLLLTLEDRRRGLLFTFGLGSFGLATALSLNALTGGRYFDNAIFANLNPFSSDKAWNHVQYFLPVAGSLLVLTAAGWFARRGARFHPFHMYLAAAAAAWAVTAPKVGSDLNYQVETMVVLGLCAGWSLHSLDFFPLLLRRDPGWVTLLQLPLLLHLALNFTLTAKTVFERYVFENLRRQEMAGLHPYLDSVRGRVLSVQIDPLLQTGRRMEVEPLIYTLLVDAGLVDPEPVRRDLEAGRFDLVLLYEDVSAGRTLSKNPEVPSLPDTHLDAIRKNYRLIQHIPGPLLAGDYLYEPVDRAARAGRNAPLSRSAR